MKATKMLRRALSLLLAMSVILSLGAGAFAAEQKPETKASPGLVNGTDFLMMDFFSGTRDRDSFGWKVRTGGAANQNVTWNNNGYSSMDASLSGEDSYFYMPNDSTNRINYKIKNNDMVFVGVSMTKSSQNLDNREIDSQLYFVLNGVNTSYAETQSLHTSGDKLRFATGEQRIAFALGEAYAGEILCNLRVDLLGGQLAANASVDYIYIGQPKDFPERVDSNKALYTGGSQDDDYFSLQLDAVQQGILDETKAGIPLDIAIVFDRSQSMSQPASTKAAEYKQFNAYYPNTKNNSYSRNDITMTDNIEKAISNLEAYLKTLDTTKYDGYYRATNMLKRYNPYFINNHDGYAGEGFASWEPMRYRNGTWQMRITTGSWTADYPCGIDTVNRDSTSIAPYKVSWVSVVDGYKEWLVRTERIREQKPSSATGLSGYCKFVIATPRLTKAINATETFIRNIYNSGKSLPAGQTHNISILSFGGGVFMEGEKYIYNKYDAATDKNKQYTASLTDKLGVSQELTAMNSTANLNSLITTLRGHYTYTNTRTDWALATIKNNKKFLPAVSNDRKSIVILITDGAPTNADTMQVDVANTALSNALALKNNKTKIYTIGFMPNLNDKEAPGAFNSSDAGSAKNANSFLAACSSMYPKASQIGTYGTKDTTGTPYYMADDGTGSKLNTIFQTMQSYIIESSCAPVYDVSHLTIYDEITREFLLDTSKPIVVSADPYQGNHNFGTRAPIGNHKLTDAQLKDFNEGKSVTIQGKGYNLILTKAGELTQVKLDWTDSKYAFLREADYTAGGAYSAKDSNPAYKKGYGLHMELPLAVNRNNTLGGNNIPTNTDESGFYLPPAADSTDPLGKSIIDYPVPNANVKPNVDPVVYDYFMDLIDYINSYQNAPVAGTQAQTIFDAMSQTLQELMQYLTNDKNDYVDIDIDLYNSLDQLLNGWHAAAKADEYTADAPASNAVFDFLVDQILSYIVTLTPITEENDSCVDANGGNGVLPYEPSKETLHPNYYGPKYVVVDFDETVKTPLDKEGGLNPALQSGVTNGKIEGTNICYNFRANYNSGNKSYLEKNYTTVKYQVTAINAPKSQNGNKTVARNFYVIPANVMTYDDTLLTFDSNGWETVGNYSDGEQSHDNTVIHGYDPMYDGTYSKDYYHNALKAVTVSKTKGVAQATFTINGTGFDIFSQTSPNSGTMAVEVSTDSTFKNDYKTFIVDTYLQEATLNQIPVVRVDDLPYGTWYIRITAFYDSVYDHNYVSIWKNGGLTEESLRERYNIPADADFTFVPSASGYDHPATRLANAQNGQYNIYIDGIRVYNTLGTDISKNVVANYAYAKAGEGVASFLNMNDGLIDASGITAWNGNGVNGVLYSAAGKTTSQIGDTYAGIILGMEGALYTKQDGAKFYVCKDAALTDNVKYNGKNVYYRIQELTSPNNRKYQGLNYFYDGGSAAKPMSNKQIQEAFGGMPTYYNAKYSAMGPEKEIYLKKGDGVAFKVGNATKIMFSFKSHDGNEAKIKLVNANLSANYTTSSRVEMYFNISKSFVNNGYIFLKCESDYASLCNIKLIGATKSDVTVDAGLVAAADKVFKNAGLPIDEGADIKHTLDLASDIALNYVVPTAKLVDYDYSFMEISFNGATYFLEPEVRGEYAYFTLEGITAVDLTEKAEATLHMFFGEEEFISETDVYSVADYAYAQLNKADAAEELKAVCANLLRYGAQAQSFKGSDNAPADAAMTAEQKAYVTDLNTVSVNTVAKALGDVENGVAWAGKALVLDSKVAVKAIFDLKDFAGNKEALNLRVSYKNAKGEEVTLIIDTMEAYNADAQQYAFVVDTLLATDMRSELTMALYEGDAQISETQVYSVESYCFGKVGALADLGKALLAYSDAAKTFFAK